MESNAGALHYVDEQILNEKFIRIHPAGEALHVADFGCGVGASLFYLADNTNLPFTGVGLTISPVQAKFGQEGAQRRELNTKCSFILGDFLAPPSTKAFDLVFSIESFAHTSQPEANFRAASQTLKPGGRQVICDDFRTDTGEQGALGSHKMDMLEAYQWGWGVPGVWTTGHVVNLAEQVGLQLTRDRDLTH